MAWNRQVPYDDAGNMLSYGQENWYGSRPIVWREAAEFSAKLTYYGCHRGRSAAVFTFKDEAGHSYPMFMSDFSDSIPHMVNGVLTGIFIPAKRGSNYGLTKVG